MAAIEIDWVVTHGTLSAIWLRKRWHMLAKIRMGRVKIASAWFIAFLIVAVPVLSKAFQFYSCWKSSAGVSLINAVPGQVGTRLQMDG